MFSGAVTHNAAATTASYTLTDPSTAPGTGQAVQYPSGGGVGTWFTPLTLPESSAGWLHDNGAGSRAWSTPTYADVGADASGAAAARAAPGTCSTGQYVSATTTGGVTCSTPPVGGNVSTSGLTTNRLAKAGSSTALVDSQCSDDGTSTTCGTATNALFTAQGGTSHWTCGQLSDNTNWAGCQGNGTGLANANYAIAQNQSTGTAIGAPAGKTIYFNVNNVNYASVTTAGIAASNISATPGAGTIAQGDGSGTLNNWITKPALYGATNGSGYSTAIDSSWTEVLYFTTGGQGGSINITGAFSGYVSSGGDCHVQIVLDRTTWLYPRMDASDPSGSHFLAFSPTVKVSLTAAAHTISLYAASTAGYTCSSPTGQSSLTGVHVW